MPLRLRPLPFPNGAARLYRGALRHFATSQRGSEILELANLLDAAVVSGPNSQGAVPYDERGGMGAFGDWNVGPWCERVQAEHHRIGL